MAPSDFYTFWLPVLAVLSAGAVLSWSTVVGVPNDTSPHRQSYRDPAAIGLVVLAAVLLGLAIIPSAGWGFVDDVYFFYNYMLGRRVPPPIWPEAGRFFPLGHQEWRLFYTWTDSIYAYQAFCIVQYFAFGLGVFVLMKRLGTFSRFSLVFILTLSPVLVSFASLPFYERHQAMLLPWMVFFLVSWDAALKPRYFFLALICVHIFLYLKEPSFVFVSILAGLRLLPQLTAAWHAIRDRAYRMLRPIAVASMAEVGMLCSCLVFLFLYVMTVPLSVLSSDQVYAGRGFDFYTLPSVLVQWTKREPFLVLFLAIGGVRFARNLVQSRRLDVFDQLNAAAAAYWFMLMLGGFVGKYFGALPLAATAIAMTGVAALEVQKRGTPTARSVFAAACVLGVAINLALAIPSLMYRQDWIDRNHQAVDALLRALPDDSEDRMVFVKGDEYDARMLVAYADVIKHADVTFQLFDGVPNKCIMSDRNCTERAEAPRPGQLVLDLGDRRKNRTGLLTRNDEVLWRYDDENLRAFFVAVPKPLRALFADHYKISR